MRLTLIPIVVLALCLIGWWKADPQISLGLIPLEVRIYQKGHPVNTGWLMPKSAGMDAVRSLLEKGKGTWSVSFDTWAPNIYLKSNDFTIIIISDAIIINYRIGRGNRWMQSRSPLTEKEFVRVERSILESMDKRSDGPDGEYPTIESDGRPN